MIGALRKKQGRQIKCIYQQKTGIRISKQILGIMIDNVMSAHKVNSIQKSQQLSLVCRMEYRAVPPNGSYIMNLVIPYPYLCIHKTIA